MRSSDFSIIVEYLNLAFDSYTRAARQIWGFNASRSWQHKVLQVPVYFKGNLLLDSSFTIASGEAERIIDIDIWVTFYDVKSGWICIGDPDRSLTQVGIEFASNTIAILDHDQLKAIWLKPEFV